VATPWEPLIQVTIPAAEAAEEAHQALGPTQPGEEQYYTNDSGYLGHVGGAAVNPARKVKRQQYLGAEGNSSVYAGELTGMELALKHANWLQRRKNIQMVTILSNSQAAIQAIARPGRPSGQCILRNIYIRARSLWGAGAELQVQWVPAHIGIAGNKDADQVAKLAAGQRG
jgi:ribonuclease HI